MPEASLDLNNDSILRENDIRASRQITNMQAKSKAEAM
jgi:hypothetical protein